MYSFQSTAAVRRVAIRRWVLPVLLSVAGWLAAPGALGAPAAAAVDPPGPFADLEPEAAGLALMQAVHRQASGYGDMSVELRMVLRARRGAETERSLRIFQIEMPADGNRVMVVLDSPKAVRGTALLSFAHAVGEDDQWLYLPAFSRVRKIASRNRSGPFLSSEFAFEDLTSQEVAKFSYRLLGIEDCGTQRCYRVERIPVDQYSGYSRQEVLVHKTLLRIEAIDYFNRGDRLLKQLQQSDFEHFEGRFWHPRRMLMENRMTGKSTLLEWSNFAFGSGLDAERDFSVASLRRQR